MPIARVVEVGEAVAARVVLQRSVLVVDVFQGEPDAAHEAGGERAEMHGVAVRALLRPAAEVERLHRHGLPAVERAEQGRHARRQGQAAHAFDLGPGVRHALGIPGPLRAGVDDRGGHRIEIGDLRIEDQNAVVGERPHQGAGGRVEVAGGQQLLEEGRLGPGDVELGHLHDRRIA